MHNLCRAIPLFSVFALGATRPLERTECGVPVSGLTLCLESITESGTASVELGNGGSSDVFVDLGIMLANGAHQYPNAITLSVADSGPIEVEGTLRDPALVAGRVDPFVVPLAAGAAFRVSVSLSRYLYHGAGSTRALDLGGQRRTIRAKLTGRRPDRSELTPYWTGSAVSNAITVVMPRNAEQTPVR